MGGYNYHRKSSGSPRKTPKRGTGEEVAAWISEHCFEYLDAPVMRCASLDTPVPFNIELEQNFLAKARLEEFVQKLLNY